MIFGPHTYLFMIIEDKLITFFIDRIIIYRNISRRKCFCFLHSQRNGNHYFYLDYMCMLPCSMLLFLVRPIHIHRGEINGYFPNILNITTHYEITDSYENKLITLYFNYIFQCLCL